jgi:hypothetical protein
MQRRRPLLLIILFALLLVACVPSSGSQAKGVAQRSDPTAIPSTIIPTSSAVVPKDPPDTCPVTTPPDPPFIPPPPYPHPPADRFWYGTEALWTMRDAAGKWGYSRTDAGYGNKVFWWRQGYDWRAEPYPRLTVTGRRLDAPAPPFVTSRATNGQHPDLKSFMLVGVDLPTLGCWEITGHYEGHELSFVVWVAP